MNKPIPKPNADTAPFWEACKEGRLLYQQCSACHTVQFFPRQHCTHCMATSLEWKDSSGIGRVYSHTTVYRAPSSAFKADTPYVIALVDLEEGFRLMVDMIETPIEKVTIGAPVNIVFRSSGDAILPQGMITT